MSPYYQEDGVTLYHADCRAVLPLLGQVSLVVTDPPYNARKNYGDFKDNLTSEEYVEFMREVVAECRKLAEHQFWIAPRYQMALWCGLIPDAHLIVIRRGASGPIRGGWSDQFETALAVGKPNTVMSDLWDSIRLKGEGYFFREYTYGHPGYTPSPIFARAIALLSADSVIDPFAGTGTSLVVAKKQGLKATGIELDESYCEIAAKRLSQSAFNFEEVT